jgi:hypothetical protein
MEDPILQEACFEAISGAPIRRTAFLEVKIRVSEGLAPARGQRNPWTRSRSIDFSAGSW